MTDETGTIEAPTAEAKAPKKPKTEVVSIKMLDGRVVDFPGKRRIQKEGLVGPNGELAVRFDFRNGETRLLQLRPDMIAKYALHGAGQKGHDEVAGLKDDKGQPADIDDMVLAMEELFDRLAEGKWESREPGESTAGMSILLTAICNVTGKPRDVIKNYLKDKSKAQKDALAASAKYKDEVARLRALREATKPKVDTAALESEIEALPA